MLVDGGQLDSARCLLGFPHPSGANAHRAGRYAAMQAAFKIAARNWLA